MKQLVTFFRERPHYLAALIVVIAIIWLLSGLFHSSHQESTDAPKQTHNVLIKVRAESQQAQIIERELSFAGRSAPTRKVSIKAETSGQIISVDAVRGSTVKPGSVIARIAPGERNLQLAHTKALLKQRELEYQGILALSKKGYTSKTQLAGALASLEQVRAEIKHLELDIQHTTITAPFAGIMHERPVEVGAFVNIGDTVAELVDVDPLIVNFDVPEMHIAKLRLQQPAYAELSQQQEGQIGTERVAGHVRYISNVADPNTRTFTVELSVPNPHKQLLVGMSSKVYVPIDKVKAHKVPPSLLSLGPNNVLGIKTVSTESVVEFFPVQIVRTDKDGVWLTGLAETVQIITVGQGFVYPGDKVEVVASSAPTLSTTTTIP